ncbi:hypothetical protein N7462_006823 [Penicillium macrosclerotiorum]|uniref:uncharacterized protein n=1 Tax=Penicillium macrosclerotiorum TaxID=303699 RepID=UPI002546F69F|nr:uncharacterized protein N7462_006823 [Penicillium macrosclerotiorum]KAJ5678579.1 hypothetical protein N7462_006823 [Penicillium macrosclerotiorum]
MGARETNYWDPRAMSVDEIQELAVPFARSAQRAGVAGVDIVEFHDQYGESFENVRDVTTAIRAAIVVFHCFPTSVELNGWSTLPSRQTLVAGIYWHPSCSFRDFQRWVSRRGSDTFQEGGPKGDVVLIALQFLRDPNWVFTTAEKLNVRLSVPSQFGRALLYIM